MGYVPWLNIRENELNTRIHRSLLPNCECNVNGYFLLLSPHLPFCEAIAFPKVLCTEAWSPLKAVFRGSFGEVFESRDLCLYQWVNPINGVKTGRNYEAVRLWKGEVWLGKADPWGVPSKGFLSWPFPICYSGSCSPCGEEFYLSKPLCYDFCLSISWKIWIQLTTGQNL